MKIVDLLKGAEEDWLRSRENGDMQRCSTLAAMRTTLERAEKNGFIEFEEFINMARQAGNQEHVKLLEKYLKFFQDGTKI